MSVCLNRGLLSVSVDLEPETTQLGLAEQRALEQTTLRLVELMDKYQVAVTWAVADPAVSAASERIREFNRHHEIAILGDASWVGRAAGRARFGRELSRRVVRGRGAGMAVATLVLRTSAPHEHCDLAIKQGIIAVRQPGAEDAARSAQRYAPQTLRFGLWNFAVSQLLPGPSRWLPGGGGTRAARLGIDQAIAARGLFNLTIDAPALARRGFAAQNVVERVLQHAQRRRQQGVLEIGTVGSAAAVLSRQHRGTPSRSILWVA